MSASNIQVAIKVRPILGNETEQKQSSLWRVSGNSIQLVDGQQEPFYFDHIFDQDVNNQVIFDTMAKQIVDSGIKGFNGTIFAYGQTSSGKTYTMMGEKTNPGVMELATKEIFKEIEKASDRQFLLRVGYIEIYNEKIYDLLNKSNQDLKIHETPNGDVSVNCSEFIITSEDHLISYLRMGTKQRKSGETNMNERSSRSHAIFRIIIESRKTDNKDEESVQISILNLVDLAGSERADQTGATGSRLKEGSHINKSLLFLSCVIKQLAEDKYVCYRDSKLTRILQASLGGNALTAIICTVNPTAVDETLSTLSFANRAKVVKNKPQLNEVMTDAAMMKRLEKEIYRLQSELELEKTKNSQIKVGQLQKRINEEILKFINSNSSNSSKAALDKRRRTWCPSSQTPPIIEVNSDATYFRHPTMASQMPTKLQLPKSAMNFTPHITLRDAYYQDQFKEMIHSPNIDEEFMPAEEACFAEALTPQTSPSHHLKVGFQTPKENQNLRTASLTPRLTEKESLQKVQRELQELETFTNLENKLNVEHDTYNSLKYKLECAERLIARYEKEREDSAFMKVEYLEAEVNLVNCQKRCQELESKITELESQAGEFEKASQVIAVRAVRYEKEVTELKSKVTQLEMESREAVSLEFEFQQHKIKSKRRENELLEALEEKQKEIKRLEQSLHTVTSEALNNSKEELRQVSKGLDEAETVCVKCKDLQQLLTENKQLAQNVEEINLDYRTLQLVLEKASSEAESEKLRADSLETENNGLKKDVEHLKSLNGTLEDIQHQIATLQGEKCKLESVKIDFEVMSRETANKIAKKINISQEIETLNTQRDTLAAECDNLLASIAANASIAEELNLLRTENSSLHSELQTIKTKLESAQADYANLKNENQNKADDIERMSMEVLSARNQLQTLQDEYLDIQQKYEQIQAECNRHEGTIGEIQSEYELIQKKYQNLQREYEKLENDSVQSIADCDRVQNQNENLETEIRELKAKVEEAQRKLLENDGLQTELESLKSEMKVALKRKSDSLSKQENAIDLRQENAQLKDELAKLQSHFNEMQKEYDDVSTQLVDNLADYETLENEMAKLEEELNKYKDLADEDHVKAVTAKNEQLKAENSHLTQANADWVKTVSSLTKSMQEKCDEREQLVKEIQNLSARSETPRKPVARCDQFLQLAESFVEIEIPVAEGRIKTFRAAGIGRSTAGSRMVIGSINEIVKGPFNELRGAIEFAVEQKSCTEIYDSLEVEDNLTSANSCDSLEGAGRQPNEAQIDELLEEKAHLFEKIRHLEETIATLKNQKEQLASARIEIEQLNGEKCNLVTICNQNKCQIKSLNEIISRAECENKKLIADCEQLKKTVESECDVDSVSRAIYDELKRQNDEMCEKWDKLEEYENKCVELREQLLTLQSKLGDEENLKEFNSEHEVKCAEYKSKISNLEAIANVMSEQLKINNDLPARSQLQETIAQLQEQLQACNCVELQASLTEKTKQLAELCDDKSVKYEQDICVLRERLKQQECKCQEVQIEIIELKTSLEEKIQESAEGAAKIEGLSARNANLQAECDGLQRQLVTEKKKTANLEKTLLSLEKMEEECNLLQNSVACLSQTVESLGTERNVILEQNERLSEKLLCSEQEAESLRGAVEKIVDKNKIVIEECQILKNSERSLHEQLQKIVQEHELNVRDKEKLLRESDQSSSEITKLRNECESNSTAKLDVQRKCEEMKEELNKMSAEKKSLECELATFKDQHEKLKETHQEERSLLQEKCSSLAIDIATLTATKSELQSALEKVQSHSVILLQQGKDMEEQLNLELCAVRNSNNAMAQKIDNLYEKLDRAEADLKAAKECSDKEERIIQLTSDNNSLNTKISQLDWMMEEANSQKRDLLAKTSELEENILLLKQELHESNHLKQEKEELVAQLSTKSSELEENVTLLKQELAETKQSVSHEEHLRAKKEKLLDQLTTESSILEKEFEVLQQQLDESKRSLSTEVHLKEVLEKANAERDDLIVQLTNNNNTLTTKSSELEEKLAILGNQFEESKRHLSSEVDRLQQLLADNTKVTTAQTSKIVDLASQIQALEDDLRTNQSAAAERDLLLQKLDQFQAEYDTLSLQHANLKQRRSSFEGEMDSARKVVLENTALAKKVTELQSSLEEVQSQCRLLRANNESLVTANKTLSKDLEDAKLKAGKCNTLQSEITKLQAHLETVQEEVNAAKDKQKRNYYEWQTKEFSFLEKISQLQGNVASLISEKKTIQEKLENNEKLSLSRTAQLEQQIQLLQKEHSVNLSKSISPKREKAIDNLLGENHQLKVKNMNLMDKLDSCQKSQNEERKNRRLSTHDERRRQSFWDSNRDVSTMTDPTNSECSCSELDLKLNELRQKLLIRDSQVNTLSMELKNHPLKMENATLKKLLNNEESKQQKLRQEIKKYQQLIVSRTNESRHCAACAEAAKRIIVDSSTQTAERDENECYRKLLSKYEDLKMICRSRHAKIKELEDALSTGKENAIDNTPSQQQYQKKYEHVKKELKVLQEKYWEAKTLCNIRYEQIKELNTKLSQNS